MHIQGLCPPRGSLRSAGINARSRAGRRTIPHFSDAVMSNRGSLLPREMPSGQVLSSGQWRTGSDPSRNDRHSIQRMRRSTIWWLSCCRVSLPVSIDAWLPQLKLNFFCPRSAFLGLPGRLDGTDAAALLRLPGCELAAVIGGWLANAGLTRSCSWRSLAKCQSWWLWSASRLSKRVSHREQG